MPQTTVRVFCKADKSVPLNDWLEKLEKKKPRVYVKCLERIRLLSNLGNELRRPLADLLENGIYELRMQVGTVQYRILYFFYDLHVVCLSHGLSKEDIVPPAEIDLALKRKKLVKQDPDKYTADWEV